MSAAIVMSLFEERNLMARIVALLSWNCSLAVEDVQAFFKSLKQATTEDPVVPLLVGSLVACIDRFTQVEMEPDEVEQYLLACAPLLKESWKDVPLQAGVSLLWSVFLRMIIEYFPKFERSLDVTHHKMEEIVEKAIQDGALDFFKRSMLSFVSLEEDVSPPTNIVFLDSPDDYAKALLLGQFQEVILYISSKMTDMIRRMKTRDEDVPQAHGRHRNATSVPAASAKTKGKGIESLLEFVALVYRGRENAGLELLDPRRRSFLKFIYDDRLSTLAKRAYFETLASLACGTKGAQSVYELLAGFSTTLSWDWIFGAVDWYTAEFNQNAGRGSAAEISPDDLALLRSLLRVIRFVARYSPSARITLVDSADAVRRLFALLVTRIPKELKAPLLDCIGAFCLSDGIPEQQSANIPWQVWNFLETIQVVPKTMQGGIIYDLDMIESKDETYPETLAFLRLLSTLFYPFVETAREYILPWNSPIQSTLSTQAIPCVVPEPLLAFGANNESPAVHRYLQYVLHEVFLKVPGRSFCFTGERWRMVDGCLDFMERALFSFDVEKLAPDKLDILKSVIAHPGFIVFSKILSGGAILSQMVQIVEEGVDAVNSGRHQTPFFVSAILRVLRILLRTLDVQEHVLSTILPLLRRSKDAIVQHAIASQTFTRLEELFLRVPTVIVAIADYINCTANDEVAYLSVRILYQLSNSTILTDSNTTISIESKGIYSADDLSVGNRLVGILDQSAEINRIIAGYVNRLSTDDPEDELAVASSTTDHWGNGIRMAIADLFLRNILSFQKPPSVTHLLLGFNIHGNIRESEFRHPRDWPANVQKTCIYTILELLRPQLVEVDEQNQQEEWMVGDFPLSMRHPSLVKKFYELLFYLCKEETTSGPTMRYLRYGDDFFHTQMFALPSTFAIEDRSGTPNATLVYSQLHQRAWLLKLVSLELHLASIHTEERHGRRLLGLLFAVPFEQESEMIDSLDDSGYPKILELLEEALSIIPPSISVADIQSALKHFRHIQFSSYRVLDENGCEQYDLQALLNALKSHQSQLETSGALRTTDATEEVGAEMVQIMSRFQQQNEANEVQFARSHFVQAWKQVVGVTLNQLYNQIPLVFRERVLFGIIDCVLSKLSDDSIHPNERESLCETLLMSFTRLRQDRLTLEVVRNVSLPLTSASHGDAWALPAKQFLQYFDQMVQGAVSKESSFSSRGNLYAAIINLLQYVHPSEFERKYFRHANRLRNQGGFLMDDQMSVMTTVTSLDETNLTSRLTHSNERTQLLSGFISVLKTNLDAFMGSLCGDATMESSDVWRTIAFMTMDALIILCRVAGAKSHWEMICGYLKRHNVLRHLVQELKSADDKKIIETLVSSSAGTSVFCTGQLFCRLWQPIYL